MIKKVAPTKVTGGGGFEFEDKVAAYFMCCLLDARPPLDPSIGIIKRMDFQVRADGWLFDDLLLTLENGNEKKCCAFSVKSNLQFSKTTAPQDLVENLWAQYLGDNSNIFQRDTDRIGLITAPLDADTKTKLYDLIQKARVQDSSDLYNRIQVDGYISREGRSLFEGFSCPTSLAKKYHVTKNNTSEILKCFEHLQFDFEYPASQDLSNVISLLRNRLESNDINKASLLWDALCSIARTKRSTGGYVDLPVLISNLRSKHQIKDFPEYAPLWETIKKNTKNELALIPDKIDSVISISRDKEITEINNKLKEKGVIVLIGESGSGKTVIEKSIATANLEKCKVVWINTENVFLLDKLPSLDMFKLIPDKIAFLILDGLDRFYTDDKFKKIALLLKACCYDTESLSWQVIISCQPEEWNRVRSQLSQLNIAINWEIYDITNLSADRLEPVWQKYSALKNLSLHPHLRQFVLKLKIIDLIARQISAGGKIDSQSWIGESNLISWYWKVEIESKPNNLQRGRCLKKIAEKFADDLIIEMPSTDFSTDELSIIEDLIKNRILRERDGKILFEHDLLADWTRQRILLEKYPDIFTYLKNKLMLPTWSKALRLLGLHLLETDIQKWKELLDLFGAKEVLGNMGQDLLLETSIFSSNPSSNLEKQWDELKKNNGLLLRRLLNRFLYSGSFPNQLALMFANASQNEASADILTRYRDPYWFYWIPMIKFLYSHKTEVIQLAEKQVGEIVDKWLRYSKMDWPARKEAAEIAIEVAENMLALKMSRVISYDRDHSERLAYRAGLAACNEQSDRVIDFALTACSKKEPSGRILELINKYNEKLKIEAKKVTRNRSTIPIILSSSSETPDPWPAGPKHRVNPDFHELCLESDNDQDTLYPLISAFPEKAREVILALVIEHPAPKDRYERLLEQDVGMVYVHNWFPPFYTRGPFYFFLNSNPEQGLELILSLINFTTDRWADRWTNAGKKAPVIEITFPWGNRQFTGNAEVCYWHRDVGRVSNVIPSALMVLEQWLYDRYEKEQHKEEVNKLIDKILKESSSLALIGLLISFGKKNPDLFTRNLMPLLSIPEFYSWDLEQIARGEMHQMIGWFRQLVLTKLAHKFHSMLHRSLQLDQIALKLLLNNQDVRSKFEEFRKEWKSRFEKGHFMTVPETYFENLIEIFNIANWNERVDPEHGEIFEFKMPKRIMESRKAEMKKLEERNLLIFVPVRFREILDGNRKISQDDAGKVWDIIQNADKILLTKDDHDFDSNRKENVICGGIAVLSKYFHEWLKQNPDKEKWCIAKITNIIQNPPSEREFDHEISRANWIWDRFCAEAMPAIWASEPKNRIYRRCMAILASNKHYEVISILFSSTAELRETLKDDFRQLNNFLLGWSHELWKYYRDRYRTAKTVDVDKWLKKEINAFEKGKVSISPLSWERVAKNEISRRGKLYAKERKEKGTGWRSPKETYFDLWLIKAASDWIPSLDKAKNKEEREGWLSFWKQALIWTVNYLETENDEEISGTPSEWDRWLFEKLAIQILCMAEADKPNELWMPVLDLGGEGHYWLDDFIQEWFMKGLSNEPFHNNFLKQWKEMLDYTGKSKKWESAQGRSGFYLSELRCRLLGLDYIIGHIWVENKKPVIKEMKPYYEQWAKTHLNNTRSAGMFIRFLMRPAAEEILFDGLIWLNEAAGKIGRGFFTDTFEKMPESLTDLLEITWKKHKETVKTNNLAFESFKNLLGSLVDLGNVQAIEIQQNLK